MTASAEIEQRLIRLNQKLGHYIPPRDAWTPVDEAVYTPLDLLRVPLDEAQAMQFKAIKYAFTRQYTLNDFYHRYCEERRITPDDLKTYDDLEKIPLIPDVTFKTHPSGKDFAYWILGVFTGDLPKVVIKGANPTFDDVINAFNAAGLEIAYSTGTSGRHSVIPRDKKTFYTFQYASYKTMISMWDAPAVDHSLQLFPRPTMSNLWASKVTDFASRLLKDHHYALDFAISSDLAVRAMTGKDRHEAASKSAEEQMRAIFKIGAEWLARYENTTDTIRLSGPPALFSAFMDVLDRSGKRFDFGERGMILTGGGWKTRANERISSEDFRKRVEEVLGIPETCCLDMYGMVEMNAGSFTCPEGHYYHLPYTWLKPLVLDTNLTPVGYGEWGRLAFLDALAGSYPGFIITGDRVRMLERCPVCDLSGPVLDTVIQRAPSEDVRGCAEEVRRIFEQDLKGATNDPSK